MQSIFTGNIRETEKGKIELEYKSEKYGLVWSGVEDYLVSKAYHKEELDPAFIFLYKDDSLKIVKCTITGKKYSVFYNGHRQALQVPEKRKPKVAQAMGNRRLLYNRMVARFNWCLDHKEDEKFIYKYTIYQHKTYVEVKPEELEEVRKTMQFGEYLTYGPHGTILLAKYKHESFWDDASSEIYACTREEFTNAVNRWRAGISKKPTFHSKHDTNSFSTCRNIRDNSYAMLVKLDHKYEDYSKKNKEILRERYRKHHRDRGTTPYKEGTLFLNIDKIGDMIVSKVRLPLYDCLNNSKDNFGFKRCTVIKEPNGKYYCSFPLWDCQECLPENMKSIAFDLGVTHLMTMSNGKVIDSPKFFEKNRKRLERHQRLLSKTKPGTKKYELYRKKVAQDHAKTKNCRRNFQHHLTKGIVKNYQYIFSEDLDIQGMLHNNNYRDLHRNIQDCGWYEITRQLDYKSKRAGRTYIKVPRDFASSQLCYKCGKKHPEMKSLSNRTLVCDCDNGTVIDRDLNAAYNILAKGTEMALALHV